MPSQTTIRGYLLTILVISLSISACSKKEEVKEAVVRPAKIFTVGDSTGELIRTFPGEVEATDKAIQSFRVGGELIERPAQPGQPVKKGDILAKLDPKDYKLKYDDSKAKYDLAKVPGKYGRRDSSPAPTTIRPRPVSSPPRQISSRPRQI